MVIKIALPSCIIPGMVIKVEIELALPSCIIPDMIIKLEIVSTPLMHCSWYGCQSGDSTPLMHYS